MNMAPQMKSLEEVKVLTQNLSWKKDQIKELEEEFCTLAKYFLYGGYVRVLDRYRIYIQCVEFYFHSERENGIKDPIVYHRNGHHVAGIVPYFKPLTFHAHASGYDIAFENPEQHYRASALIRSYEIYDEDKDIKDFMVFVHKYVTKYDIKKQKMVQVDEGRFEYMSTIKNSITSINTQSTYLYDILNGFGDAGTISWVDEPLPLLDSYDPQKHKRKRQGVYIGAKWQDDENQNFEIERAREWSFYRDKLVKADIR